MQPVRVLFLALFLVVLVAGCGGSENSALPTLIPTSAGNTLSESEAAGESPRGDEAASGIPPTWTPPPVQEAATPLPPPTTGSPDTAASEDEYVVQAGDTLAEIAAQFSVDLEQLAQVNGITNIDRIEVGQVLTIPR